MKELTRTQIAVISEAEAPVFQARVNAVLSAHEHITDIKYPDSGSTFCAIVTYEEHLEIAETAEDRFRMRGKRFMCNDCPYLVMDPDRRSATHWCARTEDRVKLRRPACEWFLESLENGDCHLVTAEEREAFHEEMDRLSIERRKQHRRELMMQRKEREQLAAPKGVDKTKNEAESEDRREIG